MASFSLALSCQMLGVDPKTLRRWLRLAQCSPRPDPLDARTHCLTLQQLQQLARLHARPLPTAPPIPSVPSPVPAAAPPPPASPPDAELRAALLSLQDRVSLLQEQVTQLTAALIRERDLRLQQLIGVSQPVRPPADPLPPRTSTLLAAEPAVVSTPTPPASPPPPAASPPLKPLPRHPHPPVIPLIEAREDGTVVLICPQRGLLSLVPDTPEWFAWLASLPSFRFQGPAGRFGAQRKTIGGLPTREWRAYCHYKNRQHCFYLGMTEHVTIARLEQMAATITARLAIL
jgi:hypothetical protein